MPTIIRHMQSPVMTAGPLRPVSAEVSYALLMQQLCAFSLAVCRVIEQQPPPPEPETPEQLRRVEEAAAVAAKAASEALRALLTAQGLELAARGTEAERAFAQEVDYLKVALADELLIHTAWAGQQAHLQSLLEVALFKTSRAGQEVIDRIEQLLAQSSDRSKALAPLYLYALNLGFQGRLRPLPNGWTGLEDRTSVQALKLGLFRLTHHRDPEALHALQRAAAQSNRVISEQAYLHTLQNMVPVRSWRLSRTGAWMAAWALGVLVISQIGWVALSGPLRSALVVSPPASTGTAPASAPKEEAPRGQ